MQLIKRFPNLIIIIGLLLVSTSCGTMKQGNFGKRKYTSGINKQNHSQASRSYSSTGSAQEHATNKRKKTKNNFKKKLDIDWSEGFWSYLLCGLILAAIITLAALFPIVVVILEIAIALATIAAGIFIFWAIAKFFAMIFD